MKNEKILRMLRLLSKSILLVHIHLLANAFQLITSPFSQDFVIGLSILLRGSLDDKLRWTFTLYDQDRDGFISR